MSMHTLMFQVRCVHYIHKYQNPKERHAKQGHMITPCESDLTYEWGGFSFFFFNGRKENSRSFIMDVMCSYRIDLS